MLMLYGCTNVFYKNVDGESDIVGVTIPDEEMVKLQIIQHLNGQTVKVKDRSTISHEWRSSSTNEYFGIIKIRESRYGKISVTPEEGNDGKE